MNDQNTPKSKNSNSQNDSSKKFDTTTRLDVRSTFEQDEITLVEEFQDPESSVFSEEDSVTAKVVREDLVEEESKVSKRLKEISNQKYELNASKHIFETAKKAFEGVAKPAKSVRSVELPKQSAKRELKLPLKIQRGHVIFVSGVLLSILILLTAVVLKNREGSNETTIQTENSKRGNQSVKYAPLKLSPLNVLDISFKKIEGNTLAAGQRVNLKFSIQDWQSADKDRAQIDVDLHVYGVGGKMIYFKPKLFSFDSMVNHDVEQLAVNTWIDFAKSTPPGLYRVVVTVQERSSQRKAELQSNLRIIP